MLALVAAASYRAAEGNQSQPVPEASTDARALPPIVLLAPDAELAAEPDAEAEAPPPAVAPADEATLSAPGELTVLEVRSGDSLDVLFRRHGLSVVDLARLLKLKEVAPHLKRIRPGDLIEVRHDGDSVLALTRRLDLTRSLVVEAGDDGYGVGYLDHPVEVVVRQAHGRIASSFYVAGIESGLSDQAIMRLAGIFAWDIDFALDIRRDDWFAVVYEEVWQDGEKVRDGEILAAEFRNQGRSYRAVRYLGPDGRADYYTPEGRSVRKAFLRAPVDFTRVSSNFNPNRLHPILKVKRPHQGVDYAAAQGTPIKAAGYGKVVFAGTKGGYGLAVILQHGGNVTTLYSHMSRIGSAARVGRRVQQGQVIGYVGRTGLATAPHLHYEYRLNGVHRNPRTVTLPEADPIPGELKAQFASATNDLIAELDSLAPTRLAAAE
jgi:murein DD-endopeptidase MepM/ murein hydrolase activator NlpD